MKIPGAIRRNRRGGNRGVALIAVLLLLMVASAVAVALMYTVNTEQHLQGNVIHFRLLNMSHMMNTVHHGCKKIYRCRTPSISMLTTRSTNRVCSTHGNSDCMISKDVTPCTPAHSA